MKKKSKWTKWQVGAVGVLGLTLLFQEVKGSSAFSQAVIDAHAYTSGSNQGIEGTTSPSDAGGDPFGQNQQQMDQRDPFQGQGGFFDNRQRTNTGQS